MLESISTTTFYNIPIHYTLDYSIMYILLYIVFNDRSLIFVKIIKAISRNMTIVVIVID